MDAALSFRNSLTRDRHGRNLSLSRAKRCYDGACYRGLTALPAGIVCYHGDSDVWSDWADLAWCVGPSSP